MRLAVSRDWRPSVDAGRRIAYERLVLGGFADGSGDLVVFCVETTDLDPLSEDLDVAAGLGLELGELGYQVELVPRRLWHQIAGADVVVAMLPDFDPSFAPPEARTVAWAHHDVDEWAARPQLVAYDVVLSSSTLARDRLMQVTPRARGILRVGVDTALFRPAPWPQGGRFVVVDLDAFELGYGALGSRVFEIAAGGALPVVNGALGLRELGFEDVPVYRDAEDLDRVLRELGQHPADVEARAARISGLVRAEHSYAARARDFVELAIDREVVGEPPRTAIHFGPDYTSENPYQSLLYAHLGHAGAYPVPVPGQDLVRRLRQKVESPAPPGIYHLHWTAPLLQPRELVLDAVERLDRFTGLLERFKARGGTFVWTVHNVLPHDARHRWLEGELARRLVALADTVHVLNDQTIAEAEPWYEIPPEKVLQVDLCSYIGVYPSWVTREAARARLRIAPEEKVLLALGGIRPYKGFGRLISVFDEMVREDPTLRLLVAGKPGNYPDVHDWRRRCMNHPRIIARFEHLPDDQLQVWNRAADVAVLPYTQILNSSAYSLAEAFGLTIVAPRAGALKAREGLEHVRLFEPDSDGDLRVALGEALRRSAEMPQAMSASALASAESWSPAHMADAFAKAVASWT